MNPVSIFERSRSALAAYQADLSNLAAWHEVKIAVQQASSVAAALPREQGESPAVEAARTLARELMASGAHQRLAVENDGMAISAKGWMGMLARMIAVPAWADATAPSLDKAPDWLREDYAAWLFAVPEFFVAPGQADRFAAYREARLTELATWVESNPGAAVVKVALDCYLRQAANKTLHLSNSDLRRSVELHARIMARLERKPDTTQQPLLLAREGRRLHVGFILREFDGSTEMRAALPMISHLDADRFEVDVLVQQLNDSSWEQSARKRVSQLQQLPAELAHQVAGISQACFDILIFASDLAGDTSALSQLARQRLAALQVVTAGQQTTTSGVPSIDLFVAGEAGNIAECAPQLTERLGLLQGPIRCFDQLTGGAQATTEWQRTTLGLADDAIVFVTSAIWSEVTPETQKLWVDVLSQVPGSRLVFQPAMGASPDGAARLAAEFDRLLADRGIGEDRILILQSPLPAPADVEALFALGNVFLDTASSGDEVPALSALKAGLPVITMRGSTWRARRVPAVLESLDLNELVAAAPESYVQLAVRLAKDQAARTALADRVRMEMGTPQVLDGLAAGDGFGDLLEVAFDDVLARGTTAFRADRTPVRVSPGDIPADQHVMTGAEALAQNDYFIAAAEARAALRINPASSQARALLGRAMLGLDQGVRAADYLLSATDAPGADAALWLDLARAFKMSQRGGEAVQALEVSLRLDPKQPDAWLLLIEIAENCGATDMAKDSVEALASIAPDHPHLPELRERLAASGESSSL